MDFQELIAQVEAEFKPEYEYFNLEDKDLIGIYCVYTIWGCQIVCRILATKQMASFATETAKKISRIAHEPSSVKLASLYDIYPEERPLKFLIRLRLEQRHILEELDRRHKPFKVGRAFMFMEEGKGQPEDVKEFHKLLNIENITSHRPAKESAEDLQSEAVTAAVRFFSRREESLIVTPPANLPIPPLPQDLGLPSSDPAPWDLWFRYNLKEYVRDLNADYLSLFFGQVDRTKEASRQHLRNHFERWGAQKRTGEEVAPGEADKTFFTRSRSGVWKKKGERLEDKTSQRMFEVLREAKKHKRWGPQFIKFAEFYLQGKSEKEAAKLSHITARTARNHFKKLRKIFTTQK